jgi:hypothetical protein
VKEVVAMNRTIISIVVVLAVLAALAGTYFYVRGTGTPTPATAETSCLSAVNSFEKAKMRLDAAKTELAAAEKGMTEAQTLYSKACPPTNVPKKQAVVKPKPRPTPAAVAAPCPDCSKYAWDPSDPRQPAPGTVSLRQY